MSRQEQRIWITMLIAAIVISLIITIALWS